MLLAYQAKPAPHVEKFTSALAKENLGSDPVLAPYLADLRLNAHVLKLKELIGACVRGFLSLSLSVSLSRARSL